MALDTSTLEALRSAARRVGRSPAARFRWLQAFALRSLTTSDEMKMAQEEVEAFVAFSGSGPRLHLRQAEDTVRRKLESFGHRLLAKWAEMFRRLDVRQVQDMICRGLESLGRQKRMALTYRVDGVLWHPEGSIGDASPQSQIEPVPEIEPSNLFTFAVITTLQAVAPRLRICKGGCGTLFLRRGRQEYHAKGCSQQVRSATYFADPEKRRHYYELKKARYKKKQQKKTGHDKLRIQPRRRREE
jgi:hypothetical protein